MVTTVLISSIIRNLSAEQGETDDDGEFFFVAMWQIILVHHNKKGGQKE